MSYFDLFNKFIKHQDAIQSFIMFLGIIASTVLSIIPHFLSKKETNELHEISKKENLELHKLSKEEKQKDFLNMQLIEIQRMSFYDPFVENPNYTVQWNILKNKFNNKDNDLDINSFLKYDVYTEMIYNFIEMSLKVYKTEEDLLNYIDFKSWVRNHAQNWKNPLQAHSNREVYGDKMCDMIDKWLK